jgi:hypothetical protein
VIRMRTAGSLAGLFLATALVAGPVVATTTPSPRTGAPVGAPVAASFSFRCAAEWLADRANPTVAGLQGVGNCEIDRRLDAIAKLRTGIAAAGALTTDHKNALTAILDASQSGLAALRSKIDADTSLATLRVDVHSIFADYRIYALVVRQVTLVRADDAVAAAIGRLTDGATKIQAAIAQAKTGGKDVTEATKQLAAMQAAIAAAGAQVNGDAAAILPLTPAGWNAGTAGPVLDAARASITAARAQLRTALADGKAAIAALK